MTGMTGCSTAVAPTEQAIHATNTLPAALADPYGLVGDGLYLVRANAAGGGELSAYRMPDGGPLWSTELPGPGRPYQVSGRAGTVFVTMIEGAAGAGHGRRGRGHR